MAAIATYKGRRRVLFIDEVGSRRAIYLGKVPKCQAEAVRLRVEQLVTARLTGHTVDAETARWLAEVPEGMADKLARAGLIPRQDRKSPATLAAFLDEYIAGRTADTKQSTQRHLRDARNSLVQFFGADKPLGDVTPGDADDFRRWLLKRLGDNTVRRRCGRAKQFFRAAARKRLVAHDPFADMKHCAVRPNKAREAFVTHETIERVIAEAPDAEWKLILALARYAGLRIPSELVTLTWRDVDWAHDRFTVRATKTAHADHGGIRVVPIFPELKPYLEAAWEGAEPGAEFVIAKHRGSNLNLRTAVERFIASAGVIPWPKMFVTLRSSRATERAAEHPGHVAA